MVVAETGNHSLSCTRGDISWRVWLPREIRVLPPIRVVCITYVALGCGLYWPTALPCSIIISLFEGTIGQCSLWWSVDWLLK